MNRSSELLTRLTPLALVLAAGCGGLDPAPKTSCMVPADCSAGYACVSFTCEPGTDSDTDGDGLFDADEMAGWEIVVDEQGFGLAAGADLVTRRKVTSNPQSADSDGDGLTDLEEFTERSDPRRADTDGDGLSDGDEKHRWHSNLTTVDSDGDSRDTSGSAVPLPALFDGAELKAGTSPTLADTDGDGKTDLEERDVANRDPRVAEIPQADLQTEGDLTVQMNVTYEDSNGTSTTYGNEYSTTNTTRRSRSDMESTAVTMAASQGGVGFFDDLEFSKEGAISFFGGQALELGRQGVCQLVGNGGVVFDKEDPNILEQAVNFLGGLASDIFEGANLGGTGVCDEPSPETTNTTSTTLTSESEQSATDSYSEYRTDSQTRTETAADGTVSIAFRLRNVGISTFELVNPSVTMMQWTPSPVATADQGAGAFRTLATLKPIDGGQLDANGNRTFTLGPNQDALVQMENREVNPDFIKAFLARPQAIFFSPAQFALSDRDGVDFQFLTEETFARTATLVIDDGRSPIYRRQIATNVERTEDGELAGVPMGTVLRDILEVSFTTKTAPRTNDAGETVMVAVLDSLGGLANARAADRGDPANGVSGDSEALWVVYVKRHVQAQADLPFEDLRLFPGDEVRLVYVRDHDGDGLMEREEAVLGSSDDDPDSDDDGLTDFQETKVGWDVQIAYLSGGSARTATYRVTSNPTRADSDGDGLSDLDEKAMGTDPNNPDTDDDGLGDRCEVEPLDADDTEDNFTCRPVAVAVYVTKEQRRAVDVLSVGPGAALSVRAGSPVATGDSQTAEVAITPDLRHAYVTKGRNGGVPVTAFDVDPSSGDLTRNPYTQLTTGGSLQNWRAVVADPQGQFVFAADEGPDSQRAYSYLINGDPEDGRLTFIANVSDISTPSKLAVDPMGRYLYVFGQGRDVGIYRINRDPGAPQPLGALILEDELRLPAYVVDMVIGPLGQYLYFVGQDATLGPQLMAYTIDDTDGTLTRVAGDFTAVDYGRRIAVDPDRRFLWVLTAAEVFTYVITPNTGTLGLIDADGDPINGPTGFPVAGATDLAVTPDGQHLFVTGSATHTLNVQPDGLLTETVPSVAIDGDHVTVFSRLP